MTGTFDLARRWLRRRAVSEPCRAAAAQGWALCVAPRGGKPAKNRQFDKGVAVGAFGRSWVKDVLKQLVTRLEPDNFSFGCLDLAYLKRALRRASDVYEWKEVPLGRKHNDSYVHGAVLLDVASRGRWMCLESARTYTKPARLLRSLARMPRVQVPLAGLVAATLLKDLLKALKAVLKCRSVGISSGCRPPRHYCVRDAQLG